MSGDTPQRPYAFVAWKQASFFFTVWCPGGCLTGAKAAVS